VCDITSSTSWISSPPSTDIQCTTFTIPSGVVLNVPSGTVIHATNTVTITGTLVVGNGTSSGTTPAYTPTWGSSPYTGAAASGGLGWVATQNGYSGSGVPFSVALSPFTLRKLLRPGPLGGSPGGSDPPYHGLGGGSLVIAAEGAISISGGIYATGGNGQQDNTSGYGNGGGGGGIIILASETSITNTGTIDVNGGVGAAGNGSNGLPYTSGGGGGGGTVHLLAPSITAGTIDVSGGAGGGADTDNAFGVGGGASGGNGGSPGNGSGTAATAGSNGQKFSTVVSNPATLFLP
jgi:hypothetical protein